MADKYIVESVVNNHAVKTEVWAHTPKKAQDYAKKIYGDAYSHSFRTTRVSGTKCIRFRILKEENVT